MKASQRRQAIRKDSLDLYYEDLIQEAKGREGAKAATTLLRDIRDALRSPAKDSRGFVIYPIRRLLMKYLERCISSLLNGVDPSLAFNLRQPPGRPKSSSAIREERDAANKFIQKRKTKKYVVALEESASELNKSQAYVKAAVAKWSVKDGQGVRRLLDWRVKK